MFWKKENVSEEWIRVQGYKGANELMQGHDSYQFDIGKTYKIKGKIEKCANGFHFCKELKRVYNFYSPYEHYGINETTNRYFLVECLVRKSDWENNKDIKFVAKEITFLKEIIRTNSEFLDTLVGEPIGYTTYYIKDREQAMLYVTNMEEVISEAQEKEALEQEKEKMQAELRIKNSQEELKNTLEQLGFQDLFIEMITSRRASKNSELNNFIKALGNENIGRDMLIYYILKKVGFEDKNNILGDNYEW